MNSRPRGFVLIAVAAVLVVLSSLIGGAFFYALQEQRLGRTGLAAVRALGAAETGAGAALAQWRAGHEGLLLPGDSITLAPSLPAGAGSATAGVTAWGERLALVRSHGVDPTGTAARDVALLVRLNMPAAFVPAALTTVDGSAGPLAPHVAASDYRALDWRCLEPAQEPHPAVRGGWAEPWTDWDSLAARSVSGSGLPNADRPAVRVAGDLDLIGGAGQGILLVEGDVSLAGGAMLTGLLLVRGELTFRGTGGQVTGAVRAGAIQAEPTALAGAPIVKWSSCAVLRARRAVATAERVRGWFWADLSGGW